ncbi:MAG TPA: tetratricopeptide repeat protein [Terriglobales bacterium]|nr:tetratricopeptide repeat protein [Terriglobales bacterium]
MRRQVLLYVLTSLVAASVLVLAQVSPSEQVQVGPPLRHTQTPLASATPQELEQRADELRGQKSYLDALDYYGTALKKHPGSCSLLNKIGITQLELQRFHDASKSFERAIKSDREYADAYNNLGVIYYLEKKHGKAIKQYEKAIKLRQDAASYFSNLGAAYFSKKELEKAVAAYTEAMRLDPDIFERTSHTGVQAQMSSPEDRAHFDYVMAKLFAQAGNSDRSLQYLRKALEEGYKGINDVYKDAEFAGLRKDPRFTELMAARPPGIPE